MTDQHRRQGEHRDRYLARLEGLIERARDRANGRSNRPPARPPYPDSYHHHGVETVDKSGRSIGGRA